MQSPKRICGVCRTEEVPMPGKWYVATDSAESISLIPWNGPTKDAVELCGETCALRHVSRWLELRQRRVALAARELERMVKE